MKIGRNSQCPCGSGKKYKNCCSKIENDSRKDSLPTARTRFEPGSYGGGGRPYHPSLMCFRETVSGGWEEYYCLVIKDMIFDSEETATQKATAHLNEAFARHNSTGNPAAVATVLSDYGYKKIEGFHVINEEE